MNTKITWIAVGISVLIVAVALVLAVFTIDEDRQGHQYPYKIEKKWNLPKILEEVSDISWISDSLLAAVQDENGIVFLYNLHSSKIERKIQFAKDGDYEGLAIIGSAIYVVQSDGKIFEINQYNSPDYTLTEHQTFLTEEQDVEGLAADPKNHRLLLSIKEEEPGNKNYKGIYAFDLKTKKAHKSPIYKIQFDDPIFKDLKTDKKEDIVKPSEIAIHPTTRQLFVLDASTPKLMIFDKTGKSEKMYILNEEEFNQPEGLTFSPAGDLYISNEGKNGNGNILKIELY